MATPHTSTRYLILALGAAGLIVLGGGIVAAVHGGASASPLMASFERAGWANAHPERGATAPETPSTIRALTWRQATSSAPFAPRDSHTTVVFNNALWVMGGLNANGYADENGNVRYWDVPYLRDIWRSFDGTHWERVSTDAPWGRKRSMAPAVFNGALYLIGGWSQTEGYTNTIWRTGDGTSWERIEPKGGLPPVEGAEAVVFDNKLWLIGGVHYDDREEKDFVWYTEDGVTWHQAIAHAPWAPRWDHAAAVFQGKLWVFGGMNLNDQRYNDVWMSENGITWQHATATPPWDPRQGHSAVRYDDKLWLLGRLNDDPQRTTNDVWYTENGFDWQRAHHDAPWSGREDHGVITFRDKLWVIGGMTGEYEWKNDVWYAEMATSTVNR